MEKPEWIDQEMSDIDKKIRHITELIASEKSSEEEINHLKKIRDFYFHIQNHHQDLWRLQK